MKKINLAELMALPDDTRRKVLNAIQVVHQNRKRVRELFPNSLQTKEPVKMMTVGDKAKHIQELIQNKNPKRIK